VFGGVISPFSLAGRLFDISKIIVTVRRNPDMVHKLLEKCMAFITDYVKAFKEAGTNGVIIAEPAAGLLSPAFCQEFSSDYIKKLVDEVQDEHFIIILHNCGHVEKLVPSMLSTGCDIPPGTPAENIDMFFEALNTFNNYIVIGEIA
jgi:uroporphyrinogen decarboxylase